LTRFQAPSRWWWLILLAALASVVSCSDRMPSEPRVGGTPSPHGVPSDSTLAQNWALWSASGIDTYRYRFRWECYCLESYTRLVDVTVHRGVVVSVVDVQTGRALGPEAVADYRTIDGLFEVVRDAIDRPADAVRASYDTELGYPSVVWVDFVGPMIDEELGFRIYGLTPRPQR